MGRTLSPTQSWWWLLLTAVGFVLLVLLDQGQWGLLLVVAVVVPLVIRGLWQAITEGPSALEEDAAGDDPYRCCICNEAYDMDQPHGSLNVHVERIDKRAMINVLDAVQVGGCCRPSCLREVWRRLEEAFPQGCFKYTETSIEAFSRLKE